MAKLTQTGELLSDWLRTGGKLDPSSVWQLVDQLLDQVQRLHDSGQLHRNISSSTIWIDRHGKASLRPARAEPLRCGAANERNYLPPELESIDDLILPARLDLAQKKLRELDQSCDPRRIDVYQLGVLALELLTERSVMDYLVNLQVKAAVPDQWQVWIDSALGYNAAARAQRCDQLRAKLNHIKPPEEDPRDAATPPAGTGIDLQRDTPLFGSKVDFTLSKDKLPFAQLGQYRVDTKLGSGGMGDVYLGYDSRLDRAVAIKVLPPELSRHPDFVERFNSEARAAAKLVHPHIVPIYFIGEENDNHFFVMEHVAGPTLGQLLNREGTLEVDQAMELVEQVTTGLAEAHDHGLIHRDIKPGNILLDSRTGKAKLADFGLVKSLGSDVQATATGVVMGTVDYIAPEQGRGQAVDGRADLYSIGVLLYQLLSGKLPFTADSPTAMIFQHAFEKPTPLQEVASEVPPAVRSIVERLMRKDPDERYQTAQALVDDLRAVRVGGEPSLSETPAGKSDSKSRIIFAPEIDSFDEPAELVTDPFIPMIDQGWRTRILGMFNRHAPDALKHLQNTQQNVDGAIAVYVSRRNELAALATEARLIENELMGQISEQQSAAIAAGKRADRSQDAAVAEKLRQQQALHQQTAEELSAQLNQQNEQSAEIESRLAKVDATLQQLRGQKQLLMARLQTAQAGVVVSNRGRHHAGASGKRSRFPLVAIAIAGLVAIFLWMGTYFVSDSNSKPTPPRQNIGSKNFARITRLNSASAAFGMVRKQDERDEYQIADFDVTGSDKLVVSIATERENLHEFKVTYAGHDLTKAVQLHGATTVGIYYLDNPESIALQGTISANLSGDKPNGAALHAVSLSGTAPGVSDVGMGEVGNPFGSLTVSQHNSYVITAAASDNISNSMRSNSPESNVSIEPPFIEVGRFNGHGNEMGSALAATAELVDSPAQDLTASFPGLSNRRNRESVVLAAFAPNAEHLGVGTSETNRRIVISGLDDWIDMVPIIDLTKDAVDGNWRRDGQMLVSTPFKAAKPMAVPITLNHSYEMKFNYRSEASDSAIRLAFPVGTRRSVVRLGYNNGKGVALDGVDGFEYSDLKNPTANPEFPLKPGTDHHVVLGVSVEGNGAQIWLKVDDFKLIDWSGDRDSILIPDEIDRHPFGSVPTIATEGSADVSIGKIAFLTRNSHGMLLRPAFTGPQPVTSGHQFALDFQDRSRHVTVNSFRLDCSHPLTVEAWLSPRDQAGYNRALVIMDRSYSSSTDSRYQLAVVDGFWQFRMYDPETGKLHIVASPKPMKWDHWTHVAGIFHMNKLELFVDGKSVATSAEFPTPDFSGNLLRIGAKGGKNRVFQGQMSQVRISNCVRYRGNFNPGTTLNNDDHVMALYHLDEGLGNLTRDSSGNGHHGVIRIPRWCELGTKFP